MSMTDNPFPMPRDLNQDAFTPKKIPAPPAPRQDYQKQALTALERDLQSSVEQYGQQTDPILSIKNLLKLLTHRQMQVLCNDLFKGNKDSISRIDMPDVLDKFAYGD